MKALRLVVLITSLAAPLGASAHFLELIPSSDVVEKPGAPFELSLVFTHPMENGPVMNLEKPKSFGATGDSGNVDLSGALKPVALEGKKAWKASFEQKTPGCRAFYVEPEPYWEKAERKYIIHYAKVVVDFYNFGEGWDKLVGLPMEIEPLTRPCGLYAGNEFRGIVLKDGKPLPFATVEVEYVNADGKAEAPTPLHVTQILKADGSGVFSYVMPRAGWWGFAALADGPKAKGPDGKEAETELGGLLWVKAYPLEK